MTPARFANKTVIVSGGAGGAGRAASLLFARDGARVAIVDRQRKAAESLVGEIERSGGSAHAFHADVGRPEDCLRALAEAAGRLGPPDVLVNHAGTVIVKPFLETTTSDWRRLLEVNLLSMVEICRAALPLMIDSGGGSIVNTASISGLTASAFEIAYCVTKGAVVQLTRGIAVEFRDRAIRCNAVCPGFIRTDHGQREIQGLASRGVSDIEADIARLQGRMCEPDEVAEGILFLASDAARFINGELLVIDNAALAAT